MTPEPLYRARINVPRESLDDLQEVLAVMDPAPTSWEDMDSGEAWIEICDLDHATLLQRAREMADLLQSYDGRVHVADVTRLEPQDWTEAWKSFFHTTRISERFIIHPVWEPIEAAPTDVVIDIDPGLCFGTGLHPTTRTCLKFIDQLLTASPTPLSLLDLGCGSGILSIGAAKLGATPITALDFDPDAVTVTRENLAANGIAPDSITVAVGDVTRDPLPTATIVVANILASVLIEAADRIAATVAPSGTLILSGILDSQFPDVEAAFAPLGFHCSASFLDAEWRSGLFTKEEA